MTLSRRELLVGGTAGAASVAALAATGCGGPVFTTLVQGPNTYTLPVQYATLPIGGVTIRTRTYGGTIPGPTLVAAPGQPLTITVNNQLPPNPAATPGPGIDPLDNPHAFNSTNLHVHGLQVVPHIFDPIGTTNPAASIIAIAPGTSLQYPFVLPSDHPSGLYWYHPHAHGSTDTQVGGGMAGLIIVKGPIDQVPEIAAARDIPIAVQTLNLNKDPSTGIYNDEYLAYQKPANGGYTPRSTDIFVLVNGQLVSHGSGFVSQNAAAGTWAASTPPQIQMAPGEVVRLRILNGSNSLLLPLQLSGFAVYVIAVDGVNLPAPYPVPAANNIPLASGNRVELLVQAPLTPQSSTLTALATGTLANTDQSTHNWPAFGLMQFVVSGQPVSMSIPPSLPIPTREYPLIAANSGGTRSVTLQSPAGSTIISGTALEVNNLLYNESSVMFNLPIGGGDTWTVTNQMATEGHPFHIHTNSMQIMSVTANNPQNPFSVNPLIPVPYIADTVWIPPGGTVVFQMAYKQWRGKTVFHCHKLPHEDQGMMANVMYV